MLFYDHEKKLNESENEMIQQISSIIVRAQGRPWNCDSYKALLVFMKQAIVLFKNETESISQYPQKQSKVKSLVRYDIQTLLNVLTALSP